MGRVSTQHGSQSMRGWCLRRRWRGRSKQQLNSELRYLEVGGGCEKKADPRDDGVSTGATKGWGTISVQEAEPHAT